MASRVAEVLAHRTGGVGRNVLHGRGFGGGGSYDNRVLHGAGVFENFHYLRDRGTLLPNRVVDTNKVVALAVDDRVECDSGLPGLAVTDDQLALAAANWDHRVDGFETSGHGLANRLAIDYARGDSFKCDEFVAGNRAFVIDWDAEGIHHAADDGVADGDAHDAAGALDLITLFDFGVFAEKHDTDLVFFQVHGDAGYAVREGQELSSHNLIEAVNAGDSVAERDDRANFVDRDLRFVVLDLLAD